MHSAETENMKQDSQSHDTVDEHDRHRAAERDKHHQNESHGNGQRNGNGDGHGKHGDNEHEQAEPLPENLPQISSLVVALVTIVFVVLLGALFFIGWLPERHREAKLREESAQAQDAKPVVTAASVKRQKQATELRLPGNAQALQQTQIYPRANGYLTKLYVDIGDKVKDGQLLAEIDTPEVDAQLAQAQAAVNQSKATLNKASTDFDLAKTTLDRYTGFAKSGGVTQQQLDEQTNKFTQANADLEGAKATLASSQADVQRYTASQSFEKVYAPFAGTITARGFDVGALLNANGTSGVPLFTVAKTDVLRVFVSVPQNYATLVKVGQEATFEVTNYPGKPFAGQVTRSASSLDPNTRTVLYQVDFDNKDGTLFAGMYGEVKFKLFEQNPSLLIPSSALVFDAKGLRVAVLDQDNKVHFSNIVAGRDYGTEIEALEGVKEGEKIVSNPGERLADGVQVDLAQPQQPQQPAGQTKTADAGKSDVADQSKMAAKN